MIRRLHITTNKIDYSKWEALLKQEAIRPEKAIEESYGLFEDDVLVATASRYHNVIKCVAVDHGYQGGAHFNEIVSAVMARTTQLGYFKITVYTKPENQEAFEYLGFKKIEQVDHKLVFMEKAISGFSQFIQKLGKGKIKGKVVSAIVMNANPFTKGHRYLVEKASKESDVLHLFVLSEERSVFSASTRHKLVGLGTQDLDNVHLHTTDHYMVSSATFPSYFLKEDDDVTSIQARLDARIFVHHISGALGITRRYVGSEPLSRATYLYNQALAKELEGKCELIIVQRLSNQEDVISASKVRQYLAEGEIEKTKAYVPQSTYDFFFTEEGQRVIADLKEENNEHP